MKNKDIKRKINFIKSFWMETLKKNVYTSEENQLSNLNTYLIELLNIVHSIKLSKEREKNKNIFGLSPFLSGFYKYIDNNIYFVHTYNKGREVTLLKEKIKKINSFSKDRDISNEIENLKIIAEDLKNKQEENIPKIFNELMHYIYGTRRLEDSYNYIKSLTMDLIVELILDGYSIEFLQKKVYSDYLIDFERKESVPQSLKQQFELKRNIFTNDRKQKNYLFIFRIDNLKVFYPFTLKGYTFYNPLRTGMNAYKKNIEMLSQEIGLLREEEVEYLRKDNLKSVTETRGDRSIVDYTDAHVRITIRHWSKYKAEVEARENLEEIITYLRFLYNINNLKVSESKVSISGIVKSSPLFRREKRNTKYEKTSYRDRHILREKIEELEDEGNLINILMDHSEPVRKYLRNSLQSFHHGLDDSSLINKFHNYWIALEALLVNMEVSNIKSVILNRYSNILTHNYYYFELVDIYNGISRSFWNSQKGNYEIPNEILGIEDMGDFATTLNLLVLNENLEIFIKYLKGDEYLIYRIRQYISLNKNKTYRIEFNSKLNRIYKQKLAKLYSVRNQMFHNAIKDDSMLFFYTDWLESLLYSLFSAVKENINPNDEIAFLDIKYSDFLEFIKKDNIKIIEYYFKN